MAQTDRATLEPGVHPLFGDPWWPQPSVPAYPAGLYYPAAGSGLWLGGGPPREGGRLALWCRQQRYADEGGRCTAARPPHKPGGAPLTAATVAKLLP